MVYLLYKVHSICVVSMVSPHILVIDDENSWLKNLELMLSFKNYQITTTISGKDGLELIKNSPDKYDLVLLDLMIPDLSGLEIMTALQPVFASKKINVIMQTGTPDHEDIKQTLAMGAICCLGKPYGHKELYPLIDMVLSGQEPKEKIIYPKFGQ